jgi:small-conductance mechanosensitive channel
MTRTAAEPLGEIASSRLFAIGGTPVTLGGLLASAAIIAAALLAARLLALLFRRLRARTRSGGASLYIIERLSSYALILAGGFAALTTLGVNLTSFAVFAGAIGVGVGLGLQGIVREFVSGLVIIFDRQANVGDFVEVNGSRGLITEVGPRATRLRDNDGVDIIIPNSKLIENTVINWTLHGDTRRIHVPFSAAYGADKAKVRDAVLAAARAVPFTLPETDARRCQVWLTGFGDSALNFELVVWPTLEAVKRPAAMQAAYTWAIDDALRAADIEIPFPQMDVRLRSLFGHEGSEAMGALRLEQPEHEESEQELSHNDAAESLMADAQRAAEKPAPGAPGSDEPRPPAKL